MSKLDDLLEEELAPYEGRAVAAPSPTLPSSPSPPTPSCAAGGTSPKAWRWPLPRLAAAVVLVFLAAQYLGSFLRP